MNGLIIETAFLGDAIISLSLARAIKQSDFASRVSYLVRPDVCDVISSSPDDDQVFTFDKHGSESGLKGIRTKAEELNRAGFDTLFLLHSSQRSQRLASQLNCNHKVGFEALTHSGLTHTIPDNGWQNRYERAVMLLRPMLPNAEIASLPRVNPKEVKRWDSFFQMFEHVVALALGSVWETKKWGDRKFIELAKKVSGAGTGVVVIGGSAEKEMGKEIVSACPPGSVLNLAGAATFLESLYAVQRSHLLVANDSAPTHGAVAVGTKVIAIFGPTITAFGFAPPIGSGEVIELPGLWCRPCAPHGSHTCPIYTHECMERIEVSVVLEKVFQTLGEIQV